jgi:hypothetical protein
MEYGLTPEGDNLLERSRPQDGRTVREAIRLQEESENELSGTYPAFERFDMQGQQPDGFVSAAVAPEQQPDESCFQGTKTAGQAHFDASVFAKQQSGAPASPPDTPERSLKLHEPKYAVTERETQQHVQDDAPGLLGEMTAGLTYDPVETRREVSEIKPPEKNYDRFSASESSPEKAFEDTLNASAKEFKQQEDADFERDMKSSPLYKHSVYGKYG